MPTNNSKWTIPCIYVKIQHYIPFKIFLTKVKNFILIFEDIANFDSSGFLMHGSHVGQFCSFLL